ncbi:MAG: CBS domain-containing protein [Nitriliruptorales bacterium]|nr:CBS domain-containing protein [Nitriliruptorales bacterium]
MLEVRLDDPIRLLVQGPVVEAPGLMTLRKAAARLCDHWMGALLINGLVGVEGILTERDILWAVSDGVDLDQERVRAYMTDELEIVDGDTPVRAVGEIMLRDEIRHVLVSGDDGEIVGVVSIRDVLAVALLLPSDAGAPL